MSKREGGSQAEGQAGPRLPGPLTPPESLPPQAPLPAPYPVLSSFSFSTSTRPWRHLPGLGAILCASVSGAPSGSELPSTSTLGPWPL